MKKIETTGGYTYNIPDMDEMRKFSDVEMKISYYDLYDLVLDILQSEASMEPIDETTMPEVAFQITETLAVEAIVGPLIGEGLVTEV